MDSNLKLNTPLIMDIKGNSLDDGPGMRSVVFFKGCPLDCYWCQNPESKKVESQLFFDQEKCVRCLSCVKTCPEGVLKPGLKLNEPINVNWEKCSQCFLCVDSCPSTALKRVGNQMTINEIVAKVTPYKPFFKNSGGGVTFSGGEPTLYMDYLSALLQRFKSNGIDTLVETCGLFKLDSFVEKILPYVDIIYMDMKIIDPIDHKKWCGIDNEKIKDNFIALYKLSCGGSFEIKPRTPLIPGITDTDENITNLLKFYQDHKVKLAALMKNNPVWFGKFDNIGVKTVIPADSPLREFYEQEKFENIKKVFEDNGITILES